MIDLEEIYSLISQAFHESYETFHWGDNALIKGSLETLPRPERFDDFSDGDYFALISVDTIVPERAGNYELSVPSYHYSLVLCRRGRVDDITALRNLIVNKFAEGWYRFWMKNPQWTEDLINIYPQVTELESNLDVIACQFVGTVSQITDKGGRLDE